jgi:hypothetical protein
MDELIEWWHLQPSTFGRLVVKLAVVGSLEC